MWSANNACAHYTAVPGMTFFRIGKERLRDRTKMKQKILMRTAAAYRKTLPGQHDGGISSRDADTSSDPAVNCSPLEDVEMLCHRGVGNTEAIAQSHLLTCRRTSSKIRCRSPQNYPLPWRALALVLPRAVRFARWRRRAHAASWRLPLA